MVEKELHDYIKLIHLDLSGCSMVSCKYDRFVVLCSLRR